MPVTRIALIDLAPGLSTRLRAATADRGDVIVIDETTEEVTVLLTAEDVDVVIIGHVDETAEAMAERLIDQNPDLSVVAVDPTHHRGRIYRLRPSVAEVTIGDAAQLADLACRLGAATHTWAPDDTITIDPREPA